MYFGCQGEDDCAVRFTGAPGRKDRTTVATMNHLLLKASSPVATPSPRATQLVTQKISFSSLSQRRVSRAWLSFQLPNLSAASTRSTSPLSHMEISSRHLTILRIKEQYLLGEVQVENFFSDGESDNFPWHAQDTTKILKVNDVTAGDLFKTCGALAIGRSLFVGR